MRRVIPFLLLFCCSSASIRAAEPVATRMRHVVFHLSKGIEMRVDDLTGRLVSAGSGPPVFDDVNSYVVDIQSARVSLTPESLTNLMNNYVFTGPDAPLKKLKIEIEGNELKQSGVLVKGVSVPFHLRAAISATPDGKIRLHPTSMKAAGFLSKRVLDFFGLELERLVKVNPATGVTIDGDDLLLDPERLLPPPRIKGRLTRTWIENGMVVQQFGAPGEASADAAERALQQLHVLPRRHAPLRQADDGGHRHGAGGRRSEGPVRLLTRGVQRSAGGRLLEEHAQPRSHRLYAGPGRCPAPHRSGDSGSTEGGQLPLVHVTLNSMSWRIECQTEQYFSRDNAIARSMASSGTLAFDCEMQRHRKDAMRIFVRALRLEVRAQRAIPAAPFREDVRQIHRHAPGERESQRLHG